MNIFILGFWILVCICVGLLFFTRRTLPASLDPNFSGFQLTYLVVYLLATASDWMQGPYIYALYDSYGFTTHEIEILFVAGYASSMIFGTMVGSFADKYGRRKNCLLYALLYGISCSTKHFNNFHILLFGRFVGGISTSILCSAFESWLVCEHNKRGFNNSFLSFTFSQAVLGNSLVAILSGIVAQVSVDNLGYVAPFDIAILFLSLMSVLIMCTWVENYGDQSAKPFDTFKNAISVIKSDRKIQCLGLVQSLFEGSMYTFVLEWTPALKPSHDDVVHNVYAMNDTSTDEYYEGHRGAIPHGHIFATFMVAIMIGSTLFKLLSKQFKVESFMRPVLLISSLGLVVPILFPHNQVIVYASFISFEVCVGIFWPSISTLRGKYIPESSRATIMNFFRVPLNLIVIIILTQNYEMSVIFKCCVVFLLIAVVCQHHLYRSRIHMVHHFQFLLSIVVFLRLLSSWGSQLFSKNDKSKFSF